MIKLKNIYKYSSFLNAEIIFLLYNEDYNNNFNDFAVLYTFIWNIAFVSFCNTALSLLLWTNHICALPI